VQYRGRGFFLSSVDTTTFGDKWALCRGPHHHSPDLPHIVTSPHPHSDLQPTNEKQPPPQPPTPTMPLLSLPNELLICVASELTFARDFNAFVQTNQRTHSLLNEFFYRQCAKGHCIMNDDRKSTALHIAASQSSPTGVEKVRFPPGTIYLQLYSTVF